MQHELKEFYARPFLHVELGRGDDRLQPLQGSDPEPDLHPHPPRRRLGAVEAEPHRVTPAAAGRQRRWAVRGEVTARATHRGRMDWLKPCCKASPDLVWFKRRTSDAERAIFAGHQREWAWFGPLADANHTGSAGRLDVRQRLFQASLPGRYKGFALDQWRRHTPRTDRSPLELRNRARTSRHSSPSACSFTWRWEPERRA